MCHHTKFHQNRPNALEISQFFDFQDGRRPPFWIFIFFFNSLSPSLRGPNMHRHAKFHQNRSRCGDIVFNVFQNDFF